MGSKTLAVNAILRYSGYDVGRAIQTGMMPKFRLATMPDTFFCLTAEFKAASPIRYGRSGAMTVVLIVDLAHADDIKPGVEMDVFGLPTRQIGSAVVMALRELGC